jgi:SsrA-binding protein
MAKKKEAEKAKPKPAAKSDDTGIKVVARERRAWHEFELMERDEAGLVLTGTEVKSLRNGKANLEYAHAEVERGEVWLLGFDIPEYVQAKDPEVPCGSAGHLNDCRHSTAYLVGIDRDSNGE